MRTLLRFTVPVQTGNAAIIDGALAKTIESLMKDLKPEAAYFYAQNGERAGSLVFDMHDTSQIPSIAEPLFISLNAKVEFIPVMNAEDLKKALSSIDPKKYQVAGAGK